MLEFTFITNKYTLYSPRVNNHFSIGPKCDIIGWQDYQPAGTTTCQLGSLQPTELYHCSTIYVHTTSWGVLDDCMQCSIDETIWRVSHPNSTGDTILHLPTQADMTVNTVITANTFWHNICWESCKSYSNIVICLGACGSMLTVILQRNVLWNSFTTSLIIRICLS